MCGFHHPAPRDSHINQGLWKFSGFAPSAQQVPELPAYVLPVLAAAVLAPMLSLTPGTTDDVGPCSEEPSRAVGALEKRLDSNLWRGTRGEGRCAPFGVSHAVLAESPVGDPSSTNTTARLTPTTEPQRWRHPAHGSALLAYARRALAVLACLRPPLAPLRAVHATLMSCEGSTAAQADSRTPADRVSSRAGVADVMDVAYPRHAGIVAQGLAA